MDHNCIVEKEEVNQRENNIMDDLHATANIGGGDDVGTNGSNHNESKYDAAGSSEWVDVVESSESDYEEFKYDPQYDDIDYSYLSDKVSTVLTDEEEQKIKGE